jgi:hypothetical protein
MRKPKPVRSTLGFARRRMGEYCAEPFRALNRRYFRCLIICSAALLATLPIEIIFGDGVYFRYILVFGLLFDGGVLFVISAAYDRRVAAVHRCLLENGAYVTSEASRRFVERRAFRRVPPVTLVATVCIMLFALYIVFEATHIIPQRVVGRETDLSDIIFTYPVIFMNFFNISNVSFAAAGYPAIFTDEALVVYGNAVRYDTLLGLDVGFTGETGSKTRLLTARDGSGKTVMTGRLADEDYAHLQKMLDIYTKYADALPADAAGEV